VNERKMDVMMKNWAKKLSKKSVYEGDERWPWTESVYVNKSATFDPARIYRYTLMRRWKSGCTC